MSDPRRELRKFGLLVGGILLALGTWLLVRTGGASTAGRILAAVAALLVLGGLARPIALGPVHRAWMALARVLGWVNTRLILGLVFYTLFSLVGLILFVIRKDLIGRRPAPGLETYWLDLPAKGSTKESMEHPF